MSSRGPRLQAAGPGGPRGMKLLIVQGSVAAGLASVLVMVRSLG
jgi:hypothetical protein